MSSLREQIQVLSEEIIEQNKRTEELYSTTSKLFEQKSVLIKQLLLEEKLLSGTEWILYTAQSGRSFIRYNGLALSSNEEFISLQGEMGTNWYHYSIEIDEKTVLHFDDNGLAIYFNDFALFTHIISKWGLKINVDKLLKTKTKLETELSVIDFYLKALEENNENAS